ncbi:MAG: hypothetical protein WD273_12995 [Trueperaceae bacterium]
MDWLRNEWSSRGLTLESFRGGVSLESSTLVPSESELDSLMRGCLLVPLPDSSRLRLTGADRVDFLHGQVSNDVRGLEPGSANRSLLLNHRGHALADMRVFRREDVIDIVVESGDVDLVEESLRKHIIFDQVELTRPPEAGTTLTLQGPQAAALLTAVLGDEFAGAGPAAVDPATGDSPTTKRGALRFTTAEFGGTAVTALQSRRTASGGFDLLPTVDGGQRLVEALLTAGAVAGGRPTLELARVLAGEASAAGEAGEGVLPQESGLEELVSYRKGCYLGQEIMARIEARGRLRRELAGLLLDQEPAGDERGIVLVGKPVGRLGTVARHPQLGVVALAVLRSDVPQDASLEVGGVQAKRLPLPFEPALDITSVR